MKLRFKRYWKYQFTFEDEEGGLWYNKEADDDEIYRFGVEAENEAVEEIEDGEKHWYVDGVEVEKAH